MSAEAPEGSSPPEPAIGVVLHSPGYLKLLAAAALIGIPISLAAFGFLAAVHKLEHVVWHSLPEELGYAEPPAWWAIATLGVAGVLVGLTVTHLPGHGGHVPADGLAAGPTPPSVVPGVVLAAGAGLSLGVVLGPEAPLLALGSGLALLAISRSKAAGRPDSTAIIAASGSAAAISAIFGNPLIASVMLLEVIGLARRQAMLVILPCLVSSGIGALVFTGLGDWTGLGVGALAIPDLEAEQLHLAELAWAIPFAAVVGVVTFAVFVIGRRTAALAEGRVLTVTVVAGLLAGCSAAVYALLTDHPPGEVALSGQASLAALAGDPSTWTTGALVMLLLCKSIAYALCLGVFRGGPVFPAIFIGATFGVLASSLLPGVGTVSGLAIGMAAGVAVIGLPITGVVLVVLLLGDAALSQAPVIILGMVAALIVGELLTSLVGAAEPDPTPAETDA